MDHVCAGRGQRLSFVRDQQAIDDLVQDRNPESPPSGTLAALALNWAVRRRPHDVNHVVLATDRHSGRHEGFLVAHDGRTHREPFLLLEATLTGAAADRVVVLRRMVALGILRLIGCGQPPGVIAVRTRIPALCHALYDLAHQIDAASLHPEPRTNIIGMDTALLAHRIVRALGEKPRFCVTASVMLQADGRGRRRLPERLLLGETAGTMVAVLDLRAVAEPDLVEGARWLYRSRRWATKPKGRSATGQGDAAGAASLRG
jgi:hypothetical protein